MTTIYYNPFLYHLFSSYPILYIFIVIIIFMIIWYINKHPINNPYLNKVDRSVGTIMRIKYGILDLGIITFILIVIINIIYSMISNSS
jgi:flagellar biosynthesis protein FlhB